MSAGVATAISQRADLRQRVQDLTRALDADDSAAFHMAALQIATDRSSVDQSELRQLAQDLKSALDEFRNDSRLAAMTAHEVPDAKLRLQQVLKLTDDAAHRTLDLVEQSRPIVERIGQQAQKLTAADADPRQHPDTPAFVHDTSAAMRELRAKLSEVLTAQSYQDLSGQILRNVMKLVDEIERALSRLLALSRNPNEVAPPASDPRQPSGPAGPGVGQHKTVGAQCDVDDLLSDLGL